MAKSAAERKRDEKSRRLAEGKKLYKRWVFVEHIDALDKHLATLSKPINTEGL